MMTSVFRTVRMEVDLARLAGELWTRFLRAELQMAGVGSPGRSFG